MIHILNAEAIGYSDEARIILKGVGELTEGVLSRKEIVTNLPQYDVLIVRLANQVDREVIDAGHRLKVIVTATTGLDHIDVEYARSKGITILSLLGEKEFLRTVSATAEHTWALTLALLRHIPAAFASVLEGAWNRDAFRGHELAGRRLGLVGLGRVGTKVARYGLTFGMAVAAYDPHVTGWLDDVIRCCFLHELLRQSDVLSLHIPLNTETQGLISGREFDLMPSKAVLVNTSRSEVVEENALLQALQNGHLAGAALDFLPHERYTEKRQSSTLLAYARTHNNLLITPHISGATHESMAKTEIYMAQKLAAFLKSLKK
ncbi:MAG: hypothetical protein A2169_04300 [Deltaproteobacteria bacterium RBG_13_47_9]|nr:MAG: hypothetical protein A2169_04300 [Deltaproteobacteria bacterium RBG_13_47_9]